MAQPEIFMGMSTECILGRTRQIVVICKAAVSALGRRGNLMTLVASKNQWWQRQSQVCAVCLRSPATEGFLQLPEQVPV